jgi:hypothetical protein
LFHQAGWRVASLSTVSKRFFENQPYEIVGQQAFGWASNSWCSRMRTGRKKYELSDWQLTAEQIGWELRKISDAPDEFLRDYAFCSRDYKENRTISRGGTKGVKPARNGRSISLLKWWVYAQFREGSSGEYVVGESLRAVWR